MKRIMLYIVLLGMTSGQLYADDEVHAPRVSAGKRWEIQQAAKKSIRAATPPKRTVGRLSSRVADFLKKTDGDEAKTEALTAEERARVADTREAVQRRLSDAEAAEADRLAAEEELRKRGHEAAALRRAQKMAANSTGGHMGASIVHEGDGTTDSPLENELSKRIKDARTRLNNLIDRNQPHADSEKRAARGRYQTSPLFDDPAKIKVDMKNTMKLVNVQALHDWAETAAHNPEDRASLGESQRRYAYAEALKDLRFNADCWVLALLLKTHLPEMYLHDVSVRMVSWGADARLKELEREMANLQRRVAEKKEKVAAAIAAAERMAADAWSGLSAAAQAVYNSKAMKKVTTAVAESRVGRAAASAAGYIADSRAGRATADAARYIAQTDAAKVAARTAASAASTARGWLGNGLGWMKRKATDAASYAWGSAEQATDAGTLVQDDMLAGAL